MICVSQGVSGKICNHFRRGQCQYGNRCIHVHLMPNPAHQMAPPAQEEESDDDGEEEGEGGEPKAPKPDPSGSVTGPGMGAGWWWVKRCGAWYGRCSCGVREVGYEVTGETCKVEGDGLDNAAGGGGARSGRYGQGELNGGERWCAVKSPGMGGGR